MLLHVLLTFFSEINSNNGYGVP